MKERSFRYEHARESVGHVHFDVHFRLAVRAVHHPFAWYLPSSSTNEVVLVHEGMHRYLPSPDAAVAPPSAVAPPGGSGGTVSRTRFLFVLRSQGRDGSENVWHQSVATDRGSKKGTGSLPKGFPGANPGQMHPSMFQMPLPLPFEEEFRRELYRFYEIGSRSRILRVRKEGFRTDPTGTNQAVLHGFDPSPASPEPLLLLGTRSEDPVSGPSSFEER